MSFNMRLILLAVGFTVGCLPLYSESAPLFVDDVHAEEEWQDLNKVNLSLPFDFEADVDEVAEKSHRLSPLKLPVFIKVKASMVHKDLFNPQRGYMPLSALVRSILIPTIPPLPTTAASTSSGVEVLCLLDRMNVRIRRDVFGDVNAWRSLSLGTCPVNKATSTHFYFLYDLGSCGAQLTFLADHLAYSNVVCYAPTSSGLVVRQIPFKVPVECRYHRFHNSFQVGFKPEINGVTLTWSLDVKAVVTLTAFDDGWNELAPGESYVLGDAMYFEAKVLADIGDERVFINFCYVTASHDPNSTPQYSVIENFGCMVDSIETPLSKFIPSSGTNALRFSIGSFLFLRMTDQPDTKMSLFMHCEITVGPSTATSSMKSCSYKATKDLTSGSNWQDLYSNNTACSCCDSSCPVFKQSVTRLVTSRPLAVQFGKKHDNAMEKHRASSVLGPVAWYHESDVFSDIWDFSN